MEQKALNSSFLIWKKFVLNSMKLIRKFNYLKFCIISTERSLNYLNGRVLNTCSSLHSQFQIKKPGPCYKNFDKFMNSIKFFFKDKNCRIKNKFSTFCSLWALSEIKILIFLVCLCSTINIIKLLINALAKIYIGAVIGKNVRIQ